MKKILVVSPYERDANSFWRCMGPLSYLAKYSDGQISITSARIENGIAWSDVAQYDLVFLHRPCRRDDLIVLQLAQNCNVPVWVDYDDWLFDIPSWNPNAGIYNNTETQLIMAHCIAAADMVSVSTGELYNKFKPINSSTVIIPNAYRSDLYPYREQFLAPRRNLIYWRGTNTHEADLLSVKEGFSGLNAPIRFLGGASWMILASLPKDSYSVVGSQDLFLFTKYIYDLAPKVMVFPLVDCFFNRCKSNIAYIEAMHAGALCVAPDLPEWRREGVITYAPHDSNSFRSAINEALAVSEEEHQVVLENAFERMKGNYDITVINKIREFLLNEVTTLDNRSETYKIKKVSGFDQNAAMHALARLKPEKVS